ncbi:hypothetical protein QA640_34630 [Bradyrhizobium sp. CB82]|uniref:hypothetical protein n=1 Tax=Bradyrhizobium sp. CB82 TaxID=3039159 RepID=UPI0024B1C6A0|nr:hypothetical protein [Bradyrhizobium sp. CB82]WFU39458.1 hypothetical protein QA640_34630 [Bradyrhizobium sp. CB82]
MALQAWKRAPMLLLGVVSVLWSLDALPSFWRVMPARELSRQILLDDRFKPGVLSKVLVRIEQQSAPILLPSELARAEALVRLRVAEEATERASSEEADREVALAVEKVRSSLSLNPTDSFLWLMLYSVETTRNGFDLNSISYLEQSYALAPREAWIALRRNKLALAIFPKLSEVMQVKAVSEFAGMVDGDFIEDAAMNLTTVGWLRRDRLLASLERVDIIQRKSLAKRLVGDGLKVRVPGVEIDERLWR